MLSPEGVGYADADYASAKDGLFGEGQVAFLSFPYEHFAGIASVELRLPGVNAVHDLHRGIGARLSGRRPQADGYPAEAAVRRAEVRRFHKDEPGHLAKSARWGTRRSCCALRVFHEAPGTLATDDKQKYSARLISVPH